jgi:hypothetical protein
MNKTITFLLYGEPGSARNAFQEEKYKELAESFLSTGFNVNTVPYCDELANEVEEKLLLSDAILIWVNPVENGNSRRRLDQMLLSLSSKGRFVSAHPDVILKMGTKEILLNTKNMEWGSDVKVYKSIDEFKTSLSLLIKAGETRVLKVFRGNGGNGVFKVAPSSTGGKVYLTHAAGGSEKRELTLEALFNEFCASINNDGILVDQPWNKNLFNGMVRCYVSGKKVAGFGYQEINALYEINSGSKTQSVPPGKRFYYTENCGLFTDLRQVMEGKWIPELQKNLKIEDDMLPVIWDADFFINTPNEQSPAKKYTLCEINVSCVSPFPPSAGKFIVEEVYNRLAAV